MDFQCSLQRKSKLETRNSKLARFSSFVLPLLSGKHRLHVLQARRQGVNLLLGVVKGQGGSHRGGHAEALHHRLRAVMAGAHSDAFLIQYGADIMWMDSLQQEGD